MHLTEMNKNRYTIHIKDFSTKNSTIWIQNPKNRLTVWQNWETFLLRKDTDETTKFK